MRTKILNELAGLEKKYDIKICYAVEAGSRAWGFPSKESDYDVRFIYVHQKEWYLSIDQKRDVIECPINEFLDINGWELRKTLQLFRKSNPPLMEWLYASTVYYQAYSLVEKMKALEHKVFRPQAALNHYLKMAKSNFLSIPEKEEVKIKQIINVLRPVLACIWIEKDSTFPPNEFQVLTNKLLADGQLKKDILHLVERKIGGETFIPRTHVEEIYYFLENEIIRITELAKELKGANEDITPLLDDLFIDVLEEVWNK